MPRNYFSRLNARFETLKDLDLTNKDFFQSRHQHSFLLCCYFNLVQKILPKIGDLGFTKLVPENNEMILAPKKISDLAFRKPKEKTFEAIVEEKADGN